MQLNQNQIKSKIFTIDLIIYIEWMYKNVNLKTTTKNSVSSVAIKYKHRTIFNSSCVFPFNKQDSR